MMVKNEERLRPFIIVQTLQKHPSDSSLSVAYLSALCARPLKRCPPAWPFGPKLQHCAKLSQNPVGSIK